VHLAPGSRDHADNHIVTRCSGATGRSGARVRRAIALHWSSALNHDDLLHEIEPFCRRSAPGRPTTHRLLRLGGRGRPDARREIRGPRAVLRFREPGVGLHLQ
jgi:hypothetical protein